MPWFSSSISVNEFHFYNALKKKKRKKDQAVRNIPLTSVIHKHKSVTKMKQTKKRCLSRLFFLHLSERKLIPSNIYYFIPSFTGNKCNIIFLD